MAMKKIFSMLLLVLLINPTLYCMNSDTDMASNNNVIIKLLLGGGVCISAITFYLLRRFQKKLLQHSKDIKNVCTMQKSTGKQCTFYKTTGTEIKMYGLFDDSPDDKKLDILHQQVIKRLLPSKFEILFGKRRYRKCGYGDRSFIIQCMEKQNFTGIIALVTPINKYKSVIDPVVIRTNNGDDYKALCLNDKIEETFIVKASVKDLTRTEHINIQSKRFFMAKGNISYHIALATKNVSEDKLKEILKTNNLSVLFDKNKNGLEIFQNNLTSAVFEKKVDSLESEKNDFLKECEEDKALFLIPLTSELCLNENEFSSIQLYDKMTRTLELIF